MTGTDLGFLSRTLCKAGTEGRNWLRWSVLSAGESMTGSQAPLTRHQVFQRPKCQPASSRPIGQAISTTGHAVLPKVGPCIFFQLLGRIQHLLSLYLCSRPCQSLSIGTCGGNHLSTASFWTLRPATCGQPSSRPLRELGRIADQFEKLCELIRPSNAGVKGCGGSCCVPSRCMSELECGIFAIG